MTLRVEPVSTLANALRETAAAVAVSGIAGTCPKLHVGIESKPTSNQLKQLLASVEAPFFPGAQPLDQPGKPIRLMRGTSQSDHEILEPLSYPALLTCFMQHHSSLIFRLRSGPADLNRRGVLSGCAQSSSTPATRRQGGRQALAARRVDAHGHPILRGSADRAKAPKPGFEDPSFWLPR